MFAWYERPLEPGSKEKLRVRLLANPEERAAYKARGFKFIALDVEPVPVPLEQRVAQLEAKVE